MDDICVYRLACNSIYTQNKVFSKRKCVFFLFKCSNVLRRNEDKSCRIYYYSQSISR